MPINGLLPIGAGVLWLFLLFGEIFTAHGAGDELRREREPSQRSRTPRVQLYDRNVSQASGHPGIITPTMPKPLSRSVSRTVGPPPALAHLVGQGLQWKSSMAPYPQNQMPMPVALIDRGASQSVGPERHHRSRTPSNVAATNSFQRHVTNSRLQTSSVRTPQNIERTTPTAADRYIGFQMRSLKALEQFVAHLSKTIENNDDVTNPKLLLNYGNLHLVPDERLLSGIKQDIRTELDKKLTKRRANDKGRSDARRQLERTLPRLDAFAVLKTWSDRCTAAIIDSRMVFELGERLTNMLEQKTRIDVQLQAVRELLVPKTLLNDSRSVDFYEAAYNVYEDQLVALSNPDEPTAEWFYLDVPYGIQVDSESYSMHQFVIRMLDRSEFDVEFVAPIRFLELHADVMLSVIDGTTDQWPPILKRFQQFRYSLSDEALRRFQDMEGIAVQTMRKELKSETFLQFQNKFATLHHVSRAVQQNIKFLDDLRHIKDVFFHENSKFHRIMSDDKFQRRKRDAELLLSAVAEKFRNLAHRLADKAIANVKTDSEYRLNKYYWTALVKKQKAAVADFFLCPPLQFSVNNPHPQIVEVAYQKESE